MKYHFIHHSGQEKAIVIRITKIDILKKLAIYESFQG